MQYPELESLYWFTRVAEEGSFSAVCVKLRIPKPTLSRRISQLESSLGTQLLIRNTRNLRLTEEGRFFLRHAVSILAELDEAKGKISKFSEEPRGLLRVTAGVEYGLGVLAPRIDAFSLKYPRVNVELDLTGRVVDLVNEGFDVGIRIGHLDDSTLSSRRIGFLSYAIFGSPKLLRRQRISKVSDLEPFQKLCFSRGEHRNQWHLVNGARSETLEISPRITSNHHGVLRSAAIAGLGLAFMPEFMAKDAVERKELMRVLPEWGSAQIPIQAVFPAHRHLSKKVRVFVDYLAEGTRNLN